METVALLKEKVDVIEDIEHDLIKTKVAEMCNANKPLVHNQLRQRSARQHNKSVHTSSPKV